MLDSFLKIYSTYFSFYVVFHAQNIDGTCNWNQYPNKFYDGTWSVLTIFFFMWFFMRESTFKEIVRVLLSTYHLNSLFCKIYIVDRNYNIQSEKLFYGGDWSILTTLLFYVIFHARNINEIYN